MAKLAVYTDAPRWYASFGQGTILGLRGVCAFSAPQPNPAVKRDAALKRVAPYF